MAKFCPLFSSSSGNSTYIACSEGALLVDAGVSCRRILEAVESVGEETRRIAAVLITHEHIDHIKGLKVLTKKLGVPVYATGAVLGYLCEKDMVSPGTDLREVTSEVFEAGGMEIKAFPTPHDSAGSVGYRIGTSDGHSIAVATDLGHITEEVTEGVCGCEMVLLESNYDEAMLRNGPYPYFLKQRIASGDGHLSNIHSAEFAGKLVASGTTRLMLAHLSRENNVPELAYETIKRGLGRAGYRCGVDFLLGVAPRDNPGTLVRL